MNKLLILIISLSVLLQFGCNGSDDSLEYTGIIEGTAVKVPALTPGKITKIFVNTGEMVKTGQILATVDSADFLYQRDQLTATREELVIQNKIASSNLARASKDYNYLKTKHDRIASLYKSESVTKQQLDDISNSLQNANTALSNNRQALSSIALNKKRVEAQIKSINKKIHDSRITAPLEGIITDIFYKQGEAAPQFGPIMEIIDIKKPEVKIYISQELLSQIKYGQEVEIQADGQQHSNKGVIVWISPRAEFTPKTILTPDTRTSLVYAVKISISNDDLILKHGMPVVISL